MKMRGKMKVNFFAMFKTADGKQHWAVHSYDNISRSVNMMKDIIFDDSKPICHDDAPYGRFYVVAAGVRKFQVIDRTHDVVVAVFCYEDDAHEFCDSKNGNELYCEAVESFES